ncbi:hypothetical protein PVK64_18445 [Aliivibrio sp. S4TY2]|uniref:hypothetical protein n=1 Tax=Aliivibrio TaxID=511678 RepID=UPI0023786FA6|nr:MULTISPECIES: hypothetical protein [unclassified Aliivibrio]MDD9158146.1 hypothetical protein [Aliivibrio sp. S4TY2]MDD9162061.1 hypothetical protein [Aliivibrio sp. S4TY1]MDD9165949.1 hypothetical protein [Aliivibrio sp. S4MY2]MDD9169981.1 hypothetical protein [Aliivibrio sp. S4MY4]MDD9186998.1 hypothetical protein [Aliivibrio sp. S4MY3]
MSTSNIVHYLNDEEIITLIKERKSFTLTNVKNFSQTVKRIETKIESQGLKCRVYTACRSTTMAASLASGPASIFGLASAAVIAMHNVATYSPDYEIAKYPLADKLVINYKK